MTIQQKLRTSFHFKVKKSTRTLALAGCPQKKRNLPQSLYYDAP